MELKVRITGGFDKKVGENKGRRNECCVLRSPLPNFHLRSMTFGTVSRTYTGIVQVHLPPTIDG